MTPRQWANVAEAAFDNRDRETLVRAVARLLVPDLHGLKPAELLAHRDDLLRQLVDVNDRLAAQNGAGPSRSPLPGCCRSCGSTQASIHRNRSPTMRGQPVGPRG